MPQLRQNIITGEWVVIAPERSKRPSDFISSEGIKPTTNLNCPFCADNPNYKKNRLKDFDVERKMRKLRDNVVIDENESIYVIPNKYPAFIEDESHASPRAHRLENGFYNVRPSTGGHDVLIIKKHEHQLYDFTDKVWEDLFKVAQKRYTHWRQDKNTLYSMLIYNQGINAGASIHHPHAQIFASNIVPNHITKELIGSEQYYENNGGCVFCDLIKHEQLHKVRVVEENSHFIAITFYAARFPFEVWVMPKTHSDTFENEKAETIECLANIMKKVTKRIGKTLQRPSLNFWLHDTPTTIDRADYFHWHIEIAPRVSTYGGYELGAGTVIDVIAPEDAAEFLRKPR